MTGPEVLDALETLRVQIRRAERKVESLHAQRLALYRQGRDVDPPVSHARMGAAAGVGEVAVIQTLKRAEAKEQKQAATA